MSYQFIPLDPSAMTALLDEHSVISPSDVETIEHEDMDELISQVMQKWATGNPAGPGIIVEKSEDRVVEPSKVLHYISMGGKRC